METNANTYIVRQILNKKTTTTKQIIFSFYLKKMRMFNFFVIELIIFVI